MTIEQKAKAYDEVVNKLKGFIMQGVDPLITRADAQDFFPELKETEDERIRSAIIDHLKDNNLTEWADWLEKQSEQEQLYIRFGEIPTNEKSNIYQGEIEVGSENGVSVYPAFKTDKGDIVLGLSLPITKTTLYTQQHLIEYDNRQCYLVKGDYVGKDTDGQPLINNISVIEKIDKYRVKEEKQSEQKPADEIEPKFKVGDIVQYITDSTDRRKIEEIDTLCNMYHTDSSPIMFEIEDEWKVVVNADDEIEIPFATKDNELQEATYCIPKGFHAEMDDDKVVIKKGSPI